MTNAVRTVRGGARTWAQMTARLMSVAGLLFLSLTGCIGDAPPVNQKNGGGAFGHGGAGRGGGGAGGMGDGGAAGTSVPASGGQTGLGGGGSTGAGGAGNGAGAAGSAAGGRGGNGAGDGNAAGGGGIAGAHLPGVGGQGGRTTSAAKLSVDREQVSFGPVTVGSSSMASVVVVKNIGESASAPLAIAIAGTGAGMFSAVTNACAGMILVPGATCSLSVAFAPKTPGAVTTMLTITAGGASVAVSLNGTGEFASIVAGLDGALLTLPCSATTSTGYTCVSSGCDTTGGVTTVKAFPLGGVANTVYDLTFHVRGIVEGYLYQGGTRDQGMAAPTSSPDFFHRGGQVQPVGPGAATYNSYQLEVSPTISGAPATYFLNSLPITPLDPSVVGVTFPIDYTKTIRVPGGGTITFRIGDNDCRMIMNCGPTMGTMCAAPRTVSLAGASPAAPASFVQPFQGPAGAYGQWVFIDVTSVAVAP